MARTKAAPAADDMRTVKAAAVQRVLARRRPAEFREVPDTRGGTIRWQISEDELSPPNTISEWADDRLARSTPGTPLTDLLIEVFERIRTGGSAAVRDAIGLAAGLDDGQAFSVFMVLNAVPAGPGGIGTALIREWKRRGLRTTPGVPLQMEPMARNEPSLAAQRVRYRAPLGNPAGMTV